MIKALDSQDIFISNVLVSDNSSPHHNKRVDILIQNGIISGIGKALKEPFGATVVAGKNLVASLGFADLHVNVQDPGYEYKEDINTALDAAAAGGFTGILSCSTTNPSVDNKSTVEYQQRKAKGHIVDLWVSGAISKGGEGKELAEMFDMHKAGAKAFYDFKSEIQNSQLLKLALLYVKPFEGKLMLHPTEHYLQSSGVINEGIVSTRNGLHGIPDIAEEIGIQRILKLAEYTDQSIHFTTISTTKGLELIKKAKNKGLNVTCGVAIANLFFNEENINGFDSNFKVNPPLRDEKTRKSLIDGLKSGIIDVVVSDHWPQNIESKECEFEVADFGMNTLESAFGMLRTITKDKLSVHELVSILTVNPRKILNLNLPSIKEKEMANLTIFQPDQVWHYDVKQNISMGRNISLDQDLTGKIVAVINNGSVHINE